MPELNGASPVLSYRLARAGYRTLALEANLDRDTGLGAAEAYLRTGDTPFLRVQGSLDYPPLRKQRWCLILFNASLHYARDLEGTLQRAAESLQPGGRLIIMDSPISSHPEPGTGRGDRHLGQGELEEAPVAAGLRPRWVTIHRSTRWWVYQAKRWLKNQRRFSFPMIVAEQADET